MRRVRKNLVSNGLTYEHEVHAVFSYVISAVIVTVGLMVA